MTMYVLDFTVMWSMSDLNNRSLPWYEKITLDNPQSEVICTNPLVTVIVIVVWKIVFSVSKYSTHHQIGVSFFSVSSCLLASTGSEKCLSLVVCVMVHTKDPLLLFEKNSPCSDMSGFPLTI